MKNFKNSKTAKVVSGFIGLATAFAMMGSSVASADTYVFTKTLKQGVTDQEVMNLQTVLNSSADTQVSASGVGSKGMETKYFGGLTKAAVIKFQEKYAADILTPNGLTKGTGLVGPSTRAKLNAMGGVTTTTGGTTSMVPGCTSTVGYSPTTGAPCSSSVVTTATGTGAVSAMIDTASAPAGSVIKGASQKVATFKLVNSGSAAAQVTSVKLKRMGVTSDSTFRNVYLYNGDVRVTDAAAVSSGNINFTDASGIVTIPAGSSIALSVVVEVDSAALTGETLGVMLTDVTAGGASVSGLPLSGALQTVVAKPAGATEITFGATSPTSVTNIEVDPQSDYVLWQNTVQIGSRDALLSGLRFRQTGSISAGDVKNFRLYVDGVQVGSAVDVVNSNNYVDFNFASPITLKTGGRTIKLVGDIIGGSNKTFAFAVQQSVDVTFWDSQLAVIIAPTSFSAATAATHAIKQGTLTITKATDSPSGNMVLQGSNVTLAKFKLKAAGEKLKIENLRVAVTSYSGAATLSTLALRNGALYADGVQVGSTAAINSTSTTGTYTQYNLGSALIVNPGQDVTLEIRGDIYNTGATQLQNGETFVVSVQPGSSNVWRTSSYGYIANSAVSGNSLTVAQGSMTVAKATAYANQTVVVPQTAFKIGEFNITTGSTEALNLNQFTLDFTGSTDITKIQDVYVVYGSKTSTVKSTVSTTSNTFSANENLAAGVTMSAKVYATLNANATGAVTVNLRADATSQSSGNSTNANANGQTITVGTGSIIGVVDASTPVSTLVVGGTMPKVGSYKFTASNDAFTLVDLSGTTTDSSAIIELVFKDGSTEIGRQPFNGTSFTKTGLNVAVAANASKVIDVYASLGSVGTNAGTNGGNIAVALTSFKYRNSNGVETATSSFAGTGVGSSLVGNSMYVYKTKPTISNVALPTTVLADGTQTLGKIMISSDTTGGPVAWKTVRFTVSNSGAATVTPSTWRLYDDANQSTVLATGAQSGQVVTFTLTTDQEVSGSKTYVIKGDVTGSAANTSVSLKINNGAGVYAAPVAQASVPATATFVWSDESVTPHSATAASWNNDFLVKNLPTDAQTMTR